jgi:hypothetical protein
MRRSGGVARPADCGGKRALMMRLAWIAALTFAALLLSNGAQSASAQTVPITPLVRQQIGALLAEKAARTPAQRKISSRLLFASRMRRGLSPVPGIPTLRTSIGVAPDGTTLIDLRTEVTERVLRQIEELGGAVESSHPRYRAVRARVPIDQLEALAALAEVSGIRPADLAITRKIDVTEGDHAHRADQVRGSFGVDGTGVSIGVISDGVASLASLQASGDLPPTVTVLPGQAGSGSEGTAMLEIIYDLVPGAALLFATAFNSQASFAANIEALRNAGADIIVDDVGYFAEAVFQDDDVASAVNTVTDDGALYFSSAGNAGNLNDGTSGVWEGDFHFTGIAFNGDPAHDFGGGVWTNEITVDSPYVFTLQWSDSQGASGNDYDLLLLNPAATEVWDSSTDVQDGNDDPYEVIDSGPWNDTGNLLAVVRKLGQGEDRFLHLNANRGKLAIATDGQTGGHSAARDAFSVAAVDVADAGGPGGVFDGTESVETYSSDGPRRVFYEADGTPITPGDFSSTGGELRQKPDLTAADCVSTATPGFDTFCGTSAAAPHAAAIAALLLDLGSGITPQTVRNALAGTALDIEALGWDRDSGAGIAEAFASAADLGATACSDGVDNDGDGLTDLTDPGCSDAGDDSEKDASLPCDDGVDDDSDGFVDTADPACSSGNPYVPDPTAPREQTQCQDGMNNDPGQDPNPGLIDFDGGQSIWGECTGQPGGCPANASDPEGDGVANPDPQCAGKPWKDLERRPTYPCGLGAELLLLLPFLWLWRRRRAGKTL